jgi:hypothetical protein
MPSKATIRFDTEEISDISEQLIEVKNDFYTKKTCNSCGSLRFPIPTPLKVELDLKAGDICYFCQYSEGFYLSFKHRPETATKAQVRSRKLASAGMYNTLYLAIPPMIKNLYRETITNVKLIRTKGFQPYEWQIQFLSTECI